MKAPPSQHGVSDLLELVGDYSNPILKPEAAEIVKKFGEISVAGLGYPNPAHPVLARRGIFRLY